MLTNVCAARRRPRCRGSGPGPVGRDAGLVADVPDRRTPAAQATEQQVVAPVDPIIAEVRRRLAEPARRDVRSRRPRRADGLLCRPHRRAALGDQQRPQRARAGCHRRDPQGRGLGPVAGRLRAAAPGRGRGLAAPPWPMPRSLVGLAVLEYARHARGGRLDPSALSANFDQKPTLRDPKARAGGRVHHRRGRRLPGRPASQARAVPAAARGAAEGPRRRQQAGAGCGGAR